MLFIGSLLTTVSVPGFDETSSDKFLCSLYIYGQQTRLSNVHTFINPINTKWKGSFPNYKRTIHDFFSFCFEAEIQQGLADRNLHVAILLGLQQHASCPEAQAAGCRALRGMCIFCPGAKVRVKQKNELST